MIFEHTSKEPGMWRGWLRNGQSVEIVWKRHGWDFGCGVHIHSNDDDRGDRMLFLNIWRLTVVVPLGVIDHSWPVGDEPQWSAYASSEFGLTLHWGQRRTSFDWPWDWHTLAYEQAMPDGSWQEVLGTDSPPYSRDFPYRYVLKSGEVQERTATVSLRRHVFCRRAFKALGWPRRIRHSIDVLFSDEVGERSRSWKGGCIGCGYEQLPDETMHQTLRRMERDRVFQ